MKGSVFKRCTRCGRRVKRRACDKCGTSAYRWAFVVDVGRDADGKRIQHSRSGFATKADADRALQEVLSSLNDGTFVQPSDLTVAGFFLNVWFPSTAPPRVAYETWSDRKRNIENHVIPRIGGVVFQELNAAHLNRMYAQLLQAGRMAQDGGLSPTTVRRIHAMLRKAFRDAVRWGLIRTDPTEHADPPPARMVRAARKASMATWNQTQLRAFLRSTDGEALYEAWYFTSMTGVRRSELLAVAEPDLDLDRATCHVHRAIVQTHEGYHLRETPKSDASARTIHLDRSTIDMLHRHREAHAKMRRVLGKRWNPERLVFPRPEGTWWNPPAISLAFRRAVKRVRVPVIRLHDVRHTHASLLLAAGVNPKVVSERLGHSSVGFTLDTYAHVMPGMQPEAAELFRQLVFDDDTDPTNDQDHDEENDQ